MFKHNKPLIFFIGTIFAVNSIFMLLPKKYFLRKQNKTQYIMYNNNHAKQKYPS